MDITTIVKVASRAWSWNILALMHQGIPGRQAPLLTASGASRTAFAQSFSHLVNLGLIETNPGYGHPLRPEFRLTRSGIEAAAIANKINATDPVIKKSAVLRRAWTIPVLAISYKPRYFVELKNELPAITDRALSQSIKQLQSNHLLDRNVDTSKYPPRPLYHARDVGYEISQAFNLG